MTKDEFEMEMSRQSMQVHNFCEAARAFGFVIDPKDVALELAADSQEMRQAVNALRIHSEALRIGADLEWVA